MKNILLVFMLIISTYTLVSAQFDPKNLYAGISAGITYSEEEINKYIPGSIKSNLKLGYNLNRRLALGTEFTNALGLGNGEGLNIDFYKLNRLLVSGRFTFFDTKITPFVEVSAGFTGVREPNIGEDGSKPARRFGIGGSAEVGISIYDFFVSYSYDYFGRTPQESTYNQRSEDISIQYNALQIGYIYQFESFFE